MDFINFENNRPVFFINSSLVTSGKWAEMESSYQSVLPVIYHHMNIITGESFPSIDRIAKFSGICYNSAIKGIADVRYDFEAYETRTSNGNFFYTYKIPKVDMNEATIRIEKSLIDKGHWANMSFTGKALYMTLRALAVSDYDSLSDVDYEFKDKGDWFGIRNWDLINYDSKKQLCDLSGLHRNSIAGAVDNLKKLGFIRPHPKDPDGKSIILIEPPDTVYDVLLKNKNKKRKSSI